MHHERHCGPPAIICVEGAEDDDNAITSKNEIGAASAIELTTALILLPLLPSAPRHATVQRMKFSLLP